MKLTISLVVFCLACVLAILWPEREHDNGGHNHVEGIHGSQSEAPEGPGVGIHREPGGGEESTGSGPEIYWKDYPELSTKFQTVFARRFVTDGEEAASLKSIDNRTARMKANGQWNRISSSLELLAEAGMALSPSASTFYSDLRMPGYHEVANIYSRQYQEFEDWKRESINEGYHFQVDRMKDNPMVWPPEMHMALLLDESSNPEFPPSMLAKAAEHRDWMLREYAQLLGEKFVMTPTIQSTMRELQVDIPPGEQDEALGLILPEYANLMAALDDVEKRYIEGLASILSEEGSKPSSE